jgi:hypothetical protein
MRLNKTQDSLYAILSYMWGLPKTKALAKKLYAHGLQVVHSEEGDDFNKRRARQFCHVFPNSYDIHCSKALENVSERVRIGILLHEIGHIALQAFHDEGDDSCEVVVDSWVNETFPEADYKFAHHKYASSAGRKRTAKSIEHVSAEFADLLGKIHNG